MFEFEVNIREEEYRAFCIFELMRSGGDATKTSGRADGRKWTTFFSLLVLFVSIAALARMGKIGQAIGMLCIVLALLIIVLVFRKPRRKLVASQVDASIIRLKKSGKLPYDEGTSMRFEETFFEERGKNFKAEYQYSYLEWLAVDERAYYLYTAAQRAWIVPFRVFRDETERVSFETFLREKLEPRVWEELQTAMAEMAKDAIAR